MESERTPIVPANRLLEVAGVLSEGAARLHEQLSHVPHAERQALLETVVAQVGDIVNAWSDLVRGVVSVNGTAAPPASAGAAPPAPAASAEPAPPAPATPVDAPLPPAGTSPPPAVEPADVSRAADPGPRTDGGARAPDPDPWSVASEAGPGGPPETSAPPRAPGTAHGSVATAVAAEAPAPTDKAWAGDSGTSSRDELTGVLNRPAGFAAMAREIERCRQDGWRFVLGYLNVDGLRRVNDSAGPRAGDELLRKVVAALRATLRSYDVILRLAGDEFLFSLPGADMTTAEGRVREFGVILGEEAPGASVSVGFAEMRDGDSLDELVARADEALVQSRRRRGRPRLR